MNSWNTAGYEKPKNPVEKKIGNEFPEPQLCSNPLGIKVYQINQKYI